MLLKDNYAESFYRASDVHTLINKAEKDSLSGGALLSLSLSACRWQEALEVKGKKKKLDRPPRLTSADWLQWPVGLLAGRPAGRSACWPVLLLLGPRPGVSSSCSLSRVKPERFDLRFCGAARCPLPAAPCCTARTLFALPPFPAAVRVAPLSWPVHCQHTQFYA